MTTIRAAVFGATGPIGRRVSRTLLERGVTVRAVSRNPENLARDYGELEVERHPADLTDPDAAAGAADGCDLVIHTVGLPAELFEQHVPIAENAVAACRKARAWPFLVTSYWSYGVGDDEPMPESRGRTGSSDKARIREAEERVFLEARGAVARLPDFYGPEPGLSLLNDALDSVRKGETASWPGDPDAPRDFLYYGDAGRLLVALAFREEAYGEAWNVPGSGPESPRALLERAARIVGTRPKVRRIRRWMARLVALFRADVRAFVDIMPIYEAPAILDTSRLEALLGEVGTTPYGEGLAATLRWLDER